MRKILVPTDFSENALNALQYALELFKYDVCEFFVLHTYQDELYQDEVLLNRETLAEITRIVSSRTEAQLDKLAGHIHEKFINPRHTIHTIAANSMLLDEADKIVDNENIDLIIMGTRGKTNDRKVTFGSHTLQVLKYVQCPVLAVPEDFKGIQPRHILFPTDYMIPYKRRELKLLCELASPYRAAIDILYISKSQKLSLRQEDNQQFIKEELCKTEINFLTIPDSNITHAISTYIQENEVDMLVMVNTRHSFLENILFQSTIDKISLHIKIPFLALQNIRRN